MEPIPDEFQDKIIQALEAQEAAQPCPRCGRTGFTLVPFFGKQGVQEELGVTVVGGRHLPTVIVHCDHCGYVMQHALGVLGLLEEARAVKGEQETVEEGEDNAEEVAHD